MNYPDIVNGIDFRDLVMVAGDSVLTTSVKVAEFFGKSHKNVLRKIRQIISECLMILPGSILSPLILLIKMATSSQCLT